MTTASTTRFPRRTGLTCWVAKEKSCCTRWASAVPGPTTARQACRERRYLWSPIPSSRSAKTQKTAALVTARLRYDQRCGNAAIATDKSGNLRQRHLLGASCSRSAASVAVFERWLASGRGHWGHSFLFRSYSGLIPEGCRPRDRRTSIPSTYRHDETFAQNASTFHQHSTKL